MTEYPAALEWTPPGEPRMGNPPYQIPWQTGPVSEVGVNGIQADEVLEQVLDYLRAVNAPPHGARLTSLAITDLESAQNWLRRRTAERVARGVEGTSTP